MAELGFGPYILNKKISYIDDLIPFTKNDYIKLKIRSNIILTFKGEKFYTGTQFKIFENIFCRESVIAVLDDIIYKTMFTFYECDSPQPGNMLPCFLTACLNKFYGASTESSNVTNGKLILWDNPEGTIIFQSIGNDVSIFFTSPIVKMATPLRFWDKLLNKWRLM